MGLFFRQGLAPTNRVETVLAEAYETGAMAAGEAKDAAKEVVKDLAQEPGANTNAFVGAAIVFLVLLVAAFVAAQLADAQTAEDTFTQALAGLTQTLLTAWSAAVVGLIGGEAIGAKS